MRLIDAEKLQRVFNEVSTSIVREPKMTKDMEHIVRACIMTTEIIKDAPTINTESVVKCKDCAFVDTLECPLNYIDKQRQRYTNRSPDWFCAEGVKKDET